MKVTKAVKARYGTSTSCYEVDLPAGLRVKLITEGGTAGSYFLDEFPQDLFPENSFERHDAVHYGVVLAPEQVLETEPNHADLPAHEVGWSNDSLLSGNQLADKYGWWNEHPTKKLGDWKHEVAEGNTRQGLLGMGCIYFG